MPVEIVTIVNSSGKIISTGKQLFGVFKEARACYSEKKAAVKAERAVRRAQTFDVPTGPQYFDDVEYGNYTTEQRRVSLDDGASQASSRRSYGSRYSRATRKARPALTEGNLKTHTEVSATTPSRAPAGYQSPYAETVGREMALSRPNLAPTAAGQRQQVPMPIFYEDEVLEPYRDPAHQQQQQQQQQQQAIPRARSDPSMHQKHKSIDMDLAYGNIPPDLEFRTDLDPAQKTAVNKEQQARELATKVEALLTEAQCAHHTANHIISHLQGNPDAAAAVALTLAELSAILGKVSPSFLAILKGGSPAVFALLASPQFLIAAGLTVGVTVVMFGGWKIVKRIKEEQNARLLAMEAAYPAQQQQPEMMQQQQQQQQQYMEPYPPTIYEDEDGEYAGEGEEPYYYEEGGGQFDEALVIEEELSSIESWRRGIVPFGEDETADLELISPEADRAMRSQYGGGDDARTERSARTHRSSKTAKSSSKTAKSHKPHKSGSSGGGSQDRHSKKDDAASEAGSQRTHRTHRTHKAEKTERSSRAADSNSKSSVRHTVKAIEDGSKDRENTIDVVLRPKKDSLLKSMFKKRKDTDERVKSKSTVKVV